MVTMEDLMLNKYDAELWTVAAILMVIAIYYLGYTVGHQDHYTAFECTRCGNMITPADCDANKAICARNTTTTEANSAPRRR